MTNELEFKMLANCPEQIPTLASLWLNEIGKPWIPNASIESAIATYQTHLNLKSMPQTIVALDKGKAIAMVSLRDNDGIRDDLTPWLGSLIVDPAYRQKGLGEYLIELTIQQAKKLGFKQLYLFTLDATISSWYQRLGWSVLGTDQLYDHPVTVMQCRI
jgi:N-acetylglutamate synthase-like GNAT family acetyltransferase